jgi:hypothetical protein
MPRHTLHLWDIRDDANPKLAIVPRADLAAHVPADTGAGRWKEVEVSFAAFVGRFQDPAALLLATAALNAPDFDQERAQ